MPSLSRQTQRVKGHFPNGPANITQPAKKFRLAESRSSHIGYECTTELVYTLHSNKNTCDQRQLFLHDVGYLRSFSASKHKGDSVILRWNLYFKIITGLPPSHHLALICKIIFNALWMAYRHSFKVLFCFKWEAKLKFVCVCLFILFFFTRTRHLYATQGGFRNTQNSGTWQFPLSAHCNTALIRKGSLLQEGLDSFSKCCQKMCSDLDRESWGQPDTKAL